MTKSLTHSMGVRAFGFPISQMSSGLGVDDQNTGILWFYGPAGAGKSAIDHNIADRCDLEKLLLANFFFSRSDPTRSNSKSFIATISYQIAINIPRARENVVAAIERDPPILSVPDLFPSFILHSP